VVSLTDIQENFKGVLCKIFFSKRKMLKHENMLKYRGVNMTKKTENIKFYYPYSL
jgi:hypothetical protein